MSVDNIRVGQLVRYKRALNKGLFLVVGKQGRWLELSPVEEKRPTAVRDWTTTSSVSVYA